MALAPEAELWRFQAALSPSRTTWVQTPRQVSEVTLIFHLRGQARKSWVFSLLLGVGRALPLSVLVCWVFLPLTPFPQLFHHWLQLIREIKCWVLGREPMALPSHQPTAGQARSWLRAVWGQPDLCTEVRRRDYSDGRETV